MTDAQARVQRARRALLVPALLGLLLVGAAPARAHDGDGPIVVVTTLPYLADVAKAVGGKHVEVEFLAPPGQDPHFIQPTPARFLTLSKADVLVENGVQLELWSERVIDGARNQKIRPGYPGHTYAATGIKPLQVPRQQSRAGGDVHVGGNPHVWLDPLNLRIVAKNVETCLTATHPAWGPEFAQNREAFEKKLDEAFFGPKLIQLLGASLLHRLHDTGRLLGFLQEKQLKGEPLSKQAGGWLAQAIALQGTTFISYHQVWIYFETAFGLKVVGTIEEKPGIPPAPAHLEELESVAKATNTRIVGCAPFYPLTRAEQVAQSIGGAAVVLPTQPGEEGTTDVFSLYDTIFARLEEARDRAAGVEAGK